MALIEGFRIQNYRLLRDIVMGRIGTEPKFQNAKTLTPLTVVIGKNGSGKSSLFDTFGFLADCMDSDLETACKAKGRGGFDKLVSNGCENQPIQLTFYYRESRNDRPITYNVAIGKDKSGLPVVLSERLRQRAKRQKLGRPRSFLHLVNGKGTVWIGDDALEPAEVWVLEKRNDGFSIVKRANEIQFVQNMVKEGQSLGALWYSDRRIGSVVLWG
jgi:predicted ATPase